MFIPPVDAGLSRAPSAAAAALVVAAAVVAAVAGGAEALPTRLAAIVSQLSTLASTFLLIK